MHSSRRSQRHHDHHHGSSRGSGSSAPRPAGRSRLQCFGWAGALLLSLFSLIGLWCMVLSLVYINQLYSAMVRQAVATGDLASAAGGPWGLAASSRLLGRAGTGTGTQAAAGEKLREAAGSGSGDLSSSAGSGGPRLAAMAVDPGAAAATLGQREAGEGSSEGQRDSSGAMDAASGGQSGSQGASGVAQHRPAQHRPAQHRPAQHRPAQHMQGAGPSAGAAADQQAAGQQAARSQTPAPTQPPTAPAAAPKVALLFLVQKEVPNEPQWRAFLEQASRMELPSTVQPPPLPPAAVAAQQAMAAGASAAAVSAAAAAADAADLREQLGKALAPVLPVYPDKLYPGFMIQHGLTPGAMPPEAIKAAAAAGVGTSMRTTSRRAAAGDVAAGRATTAAEAALAQAAGMGAVQPGGAVAAGRCVSRVVAAAAAGADFGADAAASNASTAAAVTQQAGSTSSRQRQRQGGMAAGSAAARAAAAGAGQAGHTAASELQRGALHQVEQQYRSTLPWEQLIMLEEARRLLALSPGHAGHTEPSAAEHIRHLVQSQQHAPDQQQAPDQRHAQDQQQDQQPPARPPGWQRFFSLYVHNALGHTFPAGSLFVGREVGDRANTTRAYAQHALVQAELALLAAALRDPLNTKFLLVSDSSLPLYPPQLLWAQLMAEPASRLDACPDRLGELNVYRWRPQMATPHLQRQHWRKSSQWFGLDRQHAALAVVDRHVREVFHRFCYSNLTRTRPICVSDEHMLPTLLASYGLDNQTDCLGLAHWADWSRPGWHPHAFGGQDVLDGVLVARMRAAAKTAAVAAAAIVRGEKRSEYGECEVDVALGSARVLVGRAQLGRQGGAGAGVGDDTSLVDDGPGGSAMADMRTGPAGAGADASGAVVGSAWGEGAVLPSSMPFGYQTRRAQQQALQPAPAGFLQRLAAFLGTQVGPPQLLRSWPASGRARQASQPGRAGTTTAAAGHSQQGATAGAGDSGGGAAQQQRATAAQEAAAGSAAAGSAGRVGLPQGAADAGSEQHAQQAQQNQQQQQDAPTTPYPQQLAGWARQQLGYQPLGPHCSLLARKFTAAALPGSLHMALSCGGLGLGSWCQHNQPLPGAAGVDME